MAFKITINKKLFNILKHPSKITGLVPQVRNEFRKTGPKNVRRLVLKDIATGISPVKGQGNFVKYSKTYKAMIRGELDFITIGGKVIPIVAPKGKKLKNNVTKYRKIISPVSMRLSGQMYKDLSATTKGGIKSSFRLILNWKGKLPDIHNSQGAGKSKVIRRLLPTKKGEQFNRTIHTAIMLQIRKAVKKVVNRL